MVRSLIRLGLLVVVAAGLGGAGELLAQTSKPGEPEVLPRGQVRADSEFRLFGDRDFALSGLRLAGDFSGCTQNDGNFSTPNQCWNNFHPSPLFMPDWFDIFMYFAAPPSERAKHAATVPSLNNARGKGYTVNSALSAFTGEVLPHDGTLGAVHAGATESGAGDCLDFRTLGSGNPLLAASDCPPTWGSGGWQGSRVVDIDGYLGYADQVGDANFTFDAFRVPEGLQRTDKFLGSFQTFGFFSDYSVDALFGSAIHPTYGNVIPQSMGGDPAQDPARSGWPLGMLTKMDAFSFAAPGLANTAFFQFTITNNSADVYGVGLDYDSLYMGLQPGWLTFNQGTSIYRDPANNVVRGATFCQGFVNSSSKGTSGNGCGPGGDPQHPASSWGSAPPEGVGAGFNYGAAAIVVLKSPIGDTRNKFFTNPASPFFGKGNPDAWDDTITFNHSHMCGFHGCSAVLWNAPGSTLANSDYEQRQFGMVASITPDVLGDRAVGGVAQHTLWDTWRWEEFPDVGQLDFNRWTPGNWDWNNDGVDDELVWEDCSDNGPPQFDPFTGGTKNCSVSWSDTLPGGFGNVYANRAQIVGVGPIQMAAGETVEWVIALVHGSDLASIEADIARAVDHYNAFYLGPEPAPAPAITSVEVQSGGGNAGPAGQPEATVRLYFDATSEDWEDPFLAKFLTDMLAADPATELGRIRDLNPILEDTLRALIPNNVAAIHVFKSCTGGNNFTDDSDCFTDPATGGTFGALGWLPWLTLEPNDNGDFVNSISDNGIFGGRSFLYSLITETRGLSIAVKTGEVLDTVPVNGGEEVICIQGCGSQLLEVAPGLLPTIATATSAPNVASVYIPASQQSGFAAAAVELMTASPDFIPFARMNVRATADDVRDGDYRILFADQVEVTETATVAAAGVTITGYAVDIDGGAETLTTSGIVAVEGPFQETIVGDQRSRVWTFSGLTAVLAETGGTPLMVTSDLGGGQTVPGRYFGLSNFPGFTMSIDNSLGGSFNEQFYVDADDNRIGPLVEPAVTYLQAAASAVVAEGRYRVTWLDRPYGPASPFRLNFNDPDATRSAVLQSLADRSTETATTDPELASFLGLPIEALLPARLPFRIDNITNEASPTPVNVILTRDNKLTQVLLGAQLDTLAVQVPETEWVPGDRLIIMEGTSPNFVVTFGTAILGCESTTWFRLTCNPVALGSRGATGYITAQANQELHFEYYETLANSTEYMFRVTSSMSGSGLLGSRERIRAALDSVRVVPNPFIMFSSYSTSGGEDRLIFTHVPPQGVLRVFTVSGQFVQEITWTPEDLNGRGDLWFNLRTREGNEMAAGLYLYVLTAEDENGSEIGTAKGKFVLIK